MTSKQPTTVAFHFKTPAVWVFLSFLTAIALLAWFSETPPAPRLAAHEFSATRTMADLNVLLREGVSHPTGTKRNAVVKERIAALLRGIGYLPEDQSAYVCSEEGNCAQVENLIVRIPGQVPGPTVMAVAHYDSVAAGAGAADDGSGIAILLEISRNLKAEPAHRYPILLLFDDGEEQSLLGARAFMDRSPDARNVRWAVNLDARGVSGPSMMYETSSRNLALMKLYASAVRTPVANSLMYSLYTQLPSSTDFSVFRQHGIQGFNLAFVGGTALYHRAGDVVANTSAASVQQQGGNALALVRALAADGPIKDDADDAVFFDAFRQVFWWPKTWTPILILATFVLLVGAMLWRGGPSPIGQSLLFGALTPLASILVAVAFSFLLLKAVGAGALLPPDFTAHPLPYVVAYISFAACITAVTVRWSSQRSGLWGFLFGNWLLWTLVALLVHYTIYGGSYLFLVPAIVAAVTITAVAIWGLDKSFAAELALAVPAAVAAALWFPLLRLLYQTAGWASFPVLSLTVAAILTLILPILWGRPKALNNLALISLSVAVVSIGVSFLLPRRTEKVPFPLNLQYVQEEDSQAPHWVAASRNHPLMQSLASAASFLPARNVESLVPWLPSNYPLYAAQAPALMLPSPQVTIMTQAWSGNRLSFHAKLSSRRGADRILMYFPPKAKILAMTIQGQTLAPFPPDTLQYFYNWQRYTSTVVPGGVDVQFVLDGGGVHDMYLVDESYGLPEQGKVLLNARPRNASPSQDGDSTLVFRRIQLGLP